MKKNDIFTITPPDMLLNTIGPTVTVISTNKEFIEDIEEAHEMVFQTVPVNIYHPNGDVRDHNLAWTLSVMRLSDTVFVDLDTATELGIMTAIISNANVVYIEGEKRPELIKLFNTVKADYPVYDSPREYMDIMLERFASLL